VTRHDLGDIEVAQPLESWMSELPS